MSEEEMREVLALAYSGRTREAWADAPEVWKQAWYDDTEALLPIVRRIVDEETRRVLIDAADEAATLGRRGPNAVADWLIDKASDLRPRPEP